MKTINELYYLRELSKDEINIMFNELTERWDISNHYWFPLYDTSAEPVIAFESHFGFVKLREILKNINEIFEIREFKYKGYIVKLESFEPTIGEGFWFDFSKEWIIYCSHEGSTTIGGEWLINSIKKDWNDWERHIFQVAP